MESSKKFLESSREFLNSNNFIAKLSFIILIIIVFILLFNFSYWIMSLIIFPSRSPYLIDGMADGKILKVISQDIRQGNAIPIFRSKDQYNGIEMTWSTWIYIDDPTIGMTSGDATAVNPIFVKGNNSKNVSEMDIMDITNYSTFKNSNSPGVYLQTNKPILTSSYTEANSITMNLLILLDIFPYTDGISDKKIYNQNITIENIPIKKWVSIIIRCSTQNIVDIFINGSLMKRVKLYNTIRQNYDNVYISPEGGFGGFISNLRYFDYSIGTFEINQIVSSGPNLKMADNTNIKTSNPYYLSTKWLYGEKYN